MFILFLRHTSSVFFPFFVFVCFCFDSVVVIDHRSQPPFTFIFVFYLFIQIIKFILLKLSFLVNPFLIYIDTHFFSFILTK